MTKPCSPMSREMYLYEKETCQKRPIDKKESHVGRFSDTWSLAANGPFLTSVKRDFMSGSLLTSVGLF